MIIETAGYLDYIIHRETGVLASCSPELLAPGTGTSGKAPQLPPPASVGEAATDAAWVRATFVLRRWMRSFFHCGMSGRKPEVGDISAIAPPTDPGPPPPPAPAPASSVSKCNDGRFGGWCDSIVGARLGLQRALFGALVHGYLGNWAFGIPPS